MGTACADLASVYINFEPAIHYVKLAGNNNMKMMESILFV